MLFGKRLVFLINVLCLSAAISGQPARDTVQSVNSDRDTVSYVFPFREENEKCFKCHGQAIYEYTNENLGKVIRAPMFPERIVKRDEFYRSNHKSFKCTDCHSEEYAVFPHKGELRMEPFNNCLDCHGGDEAYARYHFEAIDTAYRKSIHYKLEEGGFSCWSCHDPHEYHISVRNSENLKETILYDNNICLHCHSDYDRFQLLSERDEINIVKKHDWLPNQVLHFKSVRCIECHSKIDNELLISHEILPKDHAVRRCNECHSQNSLLMASLYKFESKAQRKDGFFNGIIMNESYVIGANRNQYLNNLSLIIFIIVIGIIGIHIIYRMLN
jgi:Zn finger protein HypA/HybF involved in hydrogenase expression